MRFGPNSAKLQILRRAVAEGNPGGAPRGDFAPVFTTWCGWRTLSAQQIVEAGFVEDATMLVVRVNDSARNRDITDADRVLLRGQQYALSKVAPPDRVGGFIELTLTRKIGG